MNCSGCLLGIGNETFVSCSSDECVRLLHISCANAQHLTPEQRETWICPDCRANVKRGDNSNTPARAHGNITLRKKNSSAPSTNQTQTSEAENSTSLELLATEIRCLRQDMANMQSEFIKRFDALTSKLLDYDVRLNTLEEKEKENNFLKLRVTQLEDQIKKQSHHLLRSELEILGLAETPNENPYHLVLTTARKIGVDLEERDIDYALRAGLQGKEDSKDTDRLPRPLVISFTRKTKRDDFLKQAKTRRTLESTDVVGTGPQRRVYVNERLTSDTRRLFRTARLWTRDHGYKYCWVRNGMVYIRKREGRDGSPPLQIRSAEDLNKLSDGRIN
ncbi:hypothetical protein ABMA27_012806 [Loxostege sticticalis]|uniref:Zinc finger PHD-type domain-containing protein n=1 Tax=Loxostege sticticalis TaxID=481309 RepID=A0ABR3GZV6_LOXSC